MWTFIIFLLFLGFADSIGGQTLVNIILILSFLLWAYSITDFRTEEEKKSDDGFNELMAHPTKRPPITLGGWGVIIILLIIIAILGN